MQFSASETVASLCKVKKKNIYDYSNVGSAGGVGGGKRGDNTLKSQEESEKINIAAVLLINER